MPDKSAGKSRYGILVYALFVNIVTLCIEWLLPSPLGYGIFYFVLSYHLAVSAIIIGKRTDLLFLTIASTCGALTSILYSLHAWSERSSVSVLQLIAIGFGCVGLLMWFLERRKNPEKVKALLEAVPKASFTDMMFFRWIPKLK